MYYSKETIAQIVDRVHLSLHDFDSSTFDLNPPFNAEAAIIAFGGQITAKHTDFTALNYSIGEVRPLQPYSEKRFEVSIPFDEYPPRKNFTLAHELGHVILHYQWADQNQWEKNCREIEVLQRNLSPNRIEYEANYFSAFFLMPENHIRSDVSRILADASMSSNLLIEQLAEKYNVSLKAMEIRLSQLGIL
ncbi:ImmA/IrrE family metallo-endopeptidase [Cohnella fermenti]|uniref:ImmA/IrrE family metallo-endopeptidase n=1 Tax=Cohnella fermenti TaxID=2565925 RepID=A0A4S4BVN0_9BACL|nr:ImmA/IrrE family metallo-endopeptidase [Cohnella fermenti]THF77063.1 ImmA/IrrE family metallo-endopeptidase [Cohnella fermenti]